MLTWLDVAAKEEQYKDLLHRAERQRFVNAVRNAMPPKRTVIHTISSWLTWLLP